MKNFSLEEDLRQEFAKIGQELQSLRAQKNLSIEAIHEKTRMPITYLQAIEEGRPDPFPAEVYLLGFLRTYALYLGADARALQGRYQQAKKTRTEKTQKAETRREAPILIVALILIGALVVVAGMLLVSSWKARGLETRNEQPAEAATTPATGGTAPHGETYAEHEAARHAAAVPALHQNGAGPVVPAPAAPAPVPEPKPAPAPMPVHRQAASEGKLNLAVTATDTAWIRIMADDQKVFEGTLQAGMSRTWHANNRIYLVIGYVPAVRATLNGKPVDVTKGAKQDMNQIMFTGADVE